MSAPITEAHYDLRRQVIFSDADEGAELIADSEARATERLRKEIDWLQINNDMLTDNPVGHARAVAERQAIIDERDQLRAEVEDLKARITQDHGIVELMEAELKDLKSAGGPPFIRSEAIRNLRDQVCGLKARAERAELRVKQLEEQK
jgi:hypothetical protein